MKLRDFDASNEERRGEPRSAVADALSVMTNHMYAIKRALDADDIKTARGLVEGAIKAFSQDNY